MLITVISMTLLLVRRAKCWVKPKKGKSLHLFKPGRGALIPSCIGEDSWTLGGYIKATHTSAEKVVLGVGYTTDSSSEESSEVDHMCNIGISMILLKFVQFRSLLVLSSDNSPQFPKRSLGKGNKEIEGKLTLISTCT